MKGRTVNFFIEPEALPEVLRAIDEDVLPRYRAFPHFVGVVVLQSTRGSRIEVAGKLCSRSSLRSSIRLAIAWVRKMSRARDVAGSK